MITASAPGKLTPADESPRAGALGYAVELGLLRANLLDRIKRKAAAVAETVALRESDCVLPAA
jgi:hypothetical protein